MKLKPSTITSSGILIYFLSILFNLPSIIWKTGAVLAVVGTIMFFIKK